MISISYFLFLVRVQHSSVCSDENLSRSWMPPRINITSLASKIGIEIVVVISRMDSIFFLHNIAFKKPREGLVGSRTSWTSIGFCTLKLRGIVSTFIVALQPFSTNSSRGHDHVYSKSVALLGTAIIFVAIVVHKKWVRGTVLISRGRTVLGVTVTVQSGLVLGKKINKLERAFT